MLHNILWLLAGAALGYLVLPRLLTMVMPKAS